MSKPKSNQWKKLKHAHGPATLVPAQVEQLVTARSPLDADNACWLLKGTLVAWEAWFEATAPALSLLLDRAPAVDDPVVLSRVLPLAADILGADQLRGWLSPLDAAITPAEQPVREVAVERKSVFVGALASEHGGVRAAAAMALAMLPELATESVPRLVHLADRDPDEIARASAVLALGRLGAGDTDLEKRIADWRDTLEFRLARGAAAVSWLRQGNDRRFEDARSGIEDWLSFRPPQGRELPWFRIAWINRTLLVSPDAPVRTLWAIAQQGGEGDEEALTDLCFSIAATTKSGAVEVQLAKLLYLLGDFDETISGLLLPRDLTPRQLAIAKRLSSTELLPHGNCGLPPSGAGRRRWFGLEPPGLLEELVDHKRSTLPRWFAVHAGGFARQNFASAEDQWRTFVEYAAMMCGSRTGWVLKGDDLAQCLASLPVDDEALARVRELADDLAARFAAAARQGMRMFPSATLGAMLLLPWVRAGRPLPPSWDVIIPTGGEPTLRELFAALPLERREAILVDLLEEPTWGRVDVAIPVLDLAPTRNVAIAAARAIDGLGDGPAVSKDLRKYREELEALYREHPTLRLE